MINTQQYTGLVVARFGEQAEVETDTGEILRCHLRQHLTQIVCGDRVLGQKNPTGLGVVTDLLPRVSLLTRCGQRENKPIAANITHLGIVLATRPELSTELLDSYLVAAQHLRLGVYILFNKTDMLSVESRHSTEILLQHYETLEYPIRWICAKQKDLDTLETDFQGKSLVFVGQSGVGKSSILSVLLPHATIKSQALSHDNTQGTHTTTTARLYHLPRGGSVIDSPGIRQFALGDISIDAIHQGFKEIAAKAVACKYRNCAHHKEPHCAVRAAKLAGEIAQHRYENYLKLTTR